MDGLYDFLNWAWARHHNPLSWYIRPLFILPFCYFAYKKSAWGVALTIVAVLSSMFWFPAPEATDPQTATFLATERQYITGPWTFSKVVMTALVPGWFIALAWAFWQRSWLAGFLVINVGALLKVIWSFYFGGTSAWSIIPAVSLGALLINGVMLYAYRRVRRHAGTTEACIRGTGREGGAGELQSNTEPWCPARKGAHVQQVLRCEKAGRTTLKREGE